MTSLDPGFRTKGLSREFYGYPHRYLELGKLGAPHVKKSLKGRNFQGSHPLILEFLSYMHIQIILGHLKMNKMKKVHVLFWITPV
jgi:hypothetical protein